MKRGSPKAYAVDFEVEAPTAIFARPDTGSTPVSYPVPTRSAVQGLFEAVARLKSAYIRPTRIEICKPIRYERYVTNYGGPLRKPAQVNKNNNYQLIATVLVDVHYRIHGVVEAIESWRGPTNHLHALQAIFNRRLIKGQCFHTPFLGWREFVPTYFGPARDRTKPDGSVNLSVPSLLDAVFDQPGGSAVAPRFIRNVVVRDGILNYEEHADAH